MLAGIKSITKNRHKTNFAVNDVTTGNDDSRDEFVQYI